MLEINEIVNRVNGFSIITERLTIKRFDIDDIEEDVAQDTHPNVVCYIKDVLSLEDAMNRVKSIAEPWKGENLEWAGLSIKLKGVS